jgi:hypothetical protein
MKTTNKSFYPLDMFEFIHHPKYGCQDLKGLSPKKFVFFSPNFAIFDIVGKINLSKNKSMRI